VPGGRVDLGGHKKMGVLNRQEIAEILAALKRRRAKAQTDLSTAVIEAWPEAVSPNPAVQRLARLLDHTLLRPEADRSGIEQCCREARQYGVAAVFVNPMWVPVAARLLAASEVRVGTVAGFPLGASVTSIKRVEAWEAIHAGAQEIDMVLNIGALKSGDLERAESDIRGVVEVCHEAGATLKVILETALLSDEEKVASCRIAVRAGADFVKTSTGFAPAGATVHDVRLMRETVGPDVGVKAAGGIRTLADTLTMLEAGANRLGSSATVAILEEAARLAI
jgi:deoxyribose-phosphate aldolase